MKFLIRYLLLLLLLFGAVHNVEAQKRKKRKSKKEQKKGKRKSKKKKSKKDKSKGGKLSKKETKKWKKKLKSLSPAKYQKLMTEYYALKDRVASAEEEATTCQNSLSEKDELIGRYQKEVTKLRKGGGSEGIASASKPVTTSAPQSVSGITYRIQIGAYEKINLSQYAKQENFGVEQAANLQKFTIGLFQDYREADTLKKYLQQMGVKDAWVVAYRDGTRVDVKEVLNQAGGAK